MVACRSHAGHSPATAPAAPLTCAFKPGGRFSRSGAGTLAELTALGKPALFVPLASSAGNEQAHNARHLQEAGAAITGSVERKSPALPHGRVRLPGGGARGPRQSAVRHHRTVLGGVTRRRSRGRWSPQAWRRVERTGPEGTARAKGLPGAALRCPLLADGSGPVPRREVGRVARRKTKRPDWLVLLTWP